MKFSYKLIVTLLLSLLYAEPAAVHAQQPFSTDDADTTERGKFHFEFFNEFDVLQKSFYPARTQNLANFLLNYGLTDRLEVGGDIPLITIFNANVSQLGDPTGIGDFNIGIKYNFYREKRGSWLPALTISNYVELPTGDVEKQLGSGLIDVNFYGVAQKTISNDIKLRANAGILFTGNNATGLVGITVLRGTVYTAGASLIKDFNSRLSLGVEMFGAWSARRGLESESQRTTLIGGSFALRDHFFFDFGVHGGKGDGSPRLGAVIGFSMDFK
jgi:hypothetical protein